MPDTERLEALRRRVQKDPASIAFAQLAEEHRRAGDYAEAIRVCRAGLVHHPGYVSAHVTLGRCLLALDDLDGAEPELAAVLRTAPENLAALRGLAEIHRRRGDLAEALAHYRAAWAMARHDPELARAVAALEQQAPTSAGETGPPTLAEPGQPHEPATEQPGVPHVPAPVAAAEDADPAAPTPTAAVPHVQPHRSWPPLHQDDSTDETLAALDSWLSAIVADREGRQRSQ